MKYMDHRGSIPMPGFVVAVALFMLLALTGAASAAEMVNDGAYANTANWTWSVSSHDAATTHTADGSGSGKTDAPGRNATATGYITQSFGSSIPVGSTVTSVVTWARHQNTAVAAATPGTITIDLQYADLTYVTIYTTNLTDSQPWTSMANGTTLPLVLAQNAVAVRITIYTKAGNNASAGSTAWVDDVSISYTPAVLTTAPGTATLSVASDTQINVTMPYTDNADTDGNCSVEYNTVNSWPGTTSSCSPVTGASPRSCNITGLNPGTLYYVRVIYTDPDGIAGGQAATQVVSNTTTYTGLGVGTVTSGTATAASVVVNAPVDSASSDTNSNATVQYQYKLTTEPTVWTNFGSAVAAKTNQSMEVTGLTASTSYDFRVVWTDANGVYNMSTKSSLGSPYTSNSVTKSTTSLVVCKSTMTICTDCHAMPPVDWVSGPVAGTTAHKGDHGIPAHTGAGTRSNCSLCHFEYTGMVNVTSVARWPFGHYNNTMDIYTSNKVANKLFAAPYDKGIKGGYYKGKRADSLIFSGNTPGVNNVCTATYCHGAGDSPVWGTGTASCGSCHAVPPAAGRHGTHSQGYVGYKDNSNASNYDFGCYKCHSDTASHAAGPVSANRAALVGFDNLSTPTNASGAYAEGSLAGTDGTYNWTDGSCTATYCHSNGAGSNVNNPTWNATPGTTCTGCHYNNKAATPNIMATGKHTAHVNNADANLAAFGCVKCHNATVSADRTLSDKSKHVDGAKDVAFDSLNPSGSYASPDCSNMYCHSSGQSTPTYRAVSWSTGTITTCNVCHGADNAITDINGSPDYANVSTSSRNTFNGHGVSGHVSAATDCIKCHNTTVDAAGAVKAGSVHLDAARDVSFALGGTYSDKRCSGTDAGSCHGATTPRWGGTLTCQDCHFDTGAIGTETDDYTYGNATRATINQAEWLTQGHGKTSGTYYWTGNAAANKVCTDCHSYGIAHNTPTNPFRLINADTNALCTGCHSSAVASHHSEAVVDATYTSGNAVWTFTPKCVDCHDPHGDTAGGITPAEYNGAMIRSKVANAGSSTYGVPSGTPVNMDFPDDDPATGVDFNYASFQQNNFSGICQVCHDAADNVANYNKTTDNTSHYSGQGKCTGCHTHDKGFAPAGGSCKGCHATGGSGSTNRPSMETEFTKTSHHINIAWASITEATCAVCHLEGNSDGSVNSTYHNAVGVAQNTKYPVDLRIIVTVGASEATTITNNTSGVEFYTGSGPYGGTRSTENTANTFCMGCHDTANAATYPFTTSEGASKKTPSAYDGSYGSIEARYGDTGTTTSHPYSPATYNVVGQLTKAYSPHGNPANNQMKNVVSGAWSNDTQTNSTHAIGCLDCHNSHGSNALTDDGTNFNGITYSSSIGAYKGGLLKTTATYDPDETATYSAGTDLCFDCHLGDGGATVPKTYTGFGVARAVKEYFDSGRWVKNSDLVTSAFTYKTGASTKNAGKISGGHLGGTSAALRGSATGTISGSCMACHDPHGTPTGGYVGTGTTRARMAPALKGTWMSSPYKEDRAPLSVTAEDTNIYSIAVKGKAAPRVTPDFPMNNPSVVGGGFGTGNATFGTYGLGGTGNDGFFIDDNTFGIPTVTNVTTDDNSLRMTGLSATHISEADSDFGGLCLGCHPKNNIDLEVGRTAVETGNVAINVHRAVKGWDTIATASDFFKPAHTQEHSMAYVTTNPTTSSVCSSAYWRLPGGYRWSVDPGTGVQVTGTGSWDAQTLPAISNKGGQTATGFTQSTFHQFPCAKCHAPHATKLPRLMKTNCLDVGTSTAAPKHGSYSYQNCDQSSATIALKPLVCHNFQKSNTSSGGGWNIQTGW